MGGREGGNLETYTREARFLSRCNQHAVAQRQPRREGREAVLECYYIMGDKWTGKGGMERELHKGRGGKSEGEGVTKTKRVKVRGREGDGYLFVACRLSELRLPPKKPRFRGVGWGATRGEGVLG